MFHLSEISLFLPFQRRRGLGGLPPCRSGRESSRFGHPCRRHFIGAGKTHSQAFAVCLLVGLLFGQPVFAVFDDNGNGMSDVWERKYQIVDADPAQDADGDGQDNLTESRAGTDPKDAQSVFEITRVEPMLSGMFLAWDSRAGMNYQVKSSRDLMDDEWVPEGVMVPGQDGQTTVVFESPLDDRRFYRVDVVEDRFGPALRALEGMTHDTDGDGRSDVDEILSGFDPFDSQNNWKSPMIRFGSGVRLAWPSEKGKHYQVQKRNTGSEEGWMDEGGFYPGTGGEIVAVIINDDGPRKEYRVRVMDVDTDQDGLSDWEELQTGLDPAMPKTDTLGSGDEEALRTMLASENVVSIKAERAVADIDRMESGGFEIRREGGVDTLTVNYSVSGTAVADTDYLELSGTATIPFGAQSVIVPVDPIESSPIHLAESVLLTLENGGSYQLSSEITQQVNVLREVLINVRDYGAMGDGVTDDTEAIQQAINALESSTDYNTLFFPSGTYRLNTAIYDPDVPKYTATSSHRILAFGKTDLAGRDILFVGEENSSLYSTVSPVRAHILFAKASFRSITMRGMTFRKDSIPLSFPGNGADGVSVYYADGRLIETLDFENCVFDNCHAAISVTNPGLDFRGKIKKFSMRNCSVVNRYGMNTVLSEKAWGGGPQIRLSLYVDEAEYVDNYFDGGSEVDSGAPESPGGKLKDGSHFGSPNHLIFRRNSVRAMGVEACYQTNDSTRIGSTTTAFVMPPADGVTVVVVGVSKENNTYRAGDILNIRAPAGPGKVAQNNIFEVVSFDPVARTIGIRNTGNPINVDPGAEISRYKAIYLQEPTGATAIIEDNFFDGSVPPHAYKPNAHTGIASNSRSRIRGNVLIGYGKCINMYDEVHTPIFPGSKGSVIDGNIILTHKPVGFPVFTYGIQSWCENLLISNNIIMIPLSVKCVGIGDRGRYARIIGNVVLSQIVQRNGYTSGNRATGIGFGNQSVNSYSEANTTYGFDVGNGVLDPSQDIPHVVKDHRSVNDVLGVDPKGLVDP